MTTAIYSPSSSSAGSVWYVGFKLCCGILLLLKHGRCGSSFMCKTGVSKAECLGYSMRTNRLSACREFCGVHIVGKMAQRCRDGVKVLWCY